MTDAPNEYTCAICGGTFKKGWSDEDAAAELRTNWPGIPPEDCAIVCDDCFRRILPEGRPLP
jgi:DNA-directed RNA polymerase subunit RPC12/RpoP